MGDMAKTIYLYAGYYEMYITDRPLDKPYVLMSKHRKVECAARAAEKAHPDDSYFYQEELFPDELSYILDEESNYHIAEVQGRNFIIT